MTSKPKQKLIGIDFDSTLAHYEHWTTASDVGAPIPAMVEQVKQAMAQGDQFAIFTARANPGDGSYEQMLSATEAMLAIADWSQKVFGMLLPVTHEKSRFFDEIWDDRARQVVENEGVFATDLLEALASHNGV
jgi:hypothetical protein